jgi:16S rRNA (guanine527-N7)-methyltransferase
MATLTHLQIGRLLSPYYPNPTPLLLEQLSTYLDLLLKWNTRTNLSAIREAEGIIQRHFGESLFAARHLPKCDTLLDLGSGAGFPGLPIALAHPQLAVTLAESQNKKACFLCEVIRTLKIPVEVWADRVERIPSGRRFDVITLRAVDNPGLALELARARMRPSGAILSLTTSPFEPTNAVPIPNTTSSFLEILR